MHRYNAFHGQTVLESELDAMFDDCEDAELNLALDTGHAQVDDAAAPDPTVYGGILQGLVVTGVAGEDHVHVSAGVARDNLGQRVYLSSGATVKITNVGLSPEGDATDALPAGASITSIGVGNYVIATLWIVYAEHLSNPRVDLLGSTAQYDVAESFCFEIQIGGAYAHPPGGAPTRASVADLKVLLADIVLTDNAGNIVIGAVAPPVCTKDEDFDDLGGNYITLTGRRSDWLSCDQGALFPQHAAQSVELRVPSARVGLYTLMARLQAQGAAPAGASYVGARAQAGTAGYGGSAKSDLAAGSADTQLLYLLDEINKKLSKGGCIPAPFYDDFLYAPKAAGTLVWDPDADTNQWGSCTSPGGTLLLSATDHYIQLASPAVAGQVAGMWLGVSSDSPNRLMFNPAVNRYEVGIRLRPVDLTDTLIRFGFYNGTCYIEGVVDGPGGTTTARVTDAAGANDTSSASVWTPIVGWTTLVLRTTGTAGASIALGPDGVPAAASCAPGIFASTGLIFYIWAESATGIHAAEAYIDAVSIGELAFRF